MKQMQRRNWTGDFYEYAFLPVPLDQRKPTSSVLIVTLGYAVALSCLVIGAKVGSALHFWQAVGVCIAGNLILMVIGTMMGIAGYTTGLSTSFLARQMFGRRASILFSALIILLSIYWVGLNGDSFARMIVAAFPRWPLPVAVTAVGLVALWGITAAYGWRGLTMTSWFLTPIALLFALGGIWIICSRPHFLQAMQDFTPSGKLTVTAAIAAVTGNYVFGSIISPDLCRFAKSRKAVVQIILPAHTIGFIVLNICGVLIAQLSGSSDFSIGVTSLGLALPFLVCSASGLWTTENYNIYGGSLAVQNLFLGTALEGNLSHRLASWMIAGLAAAFASMKALNYLMPIITLLAVLVPPVAGMMSVEYYLFSRGRTQGRDKSSRWIWIPAWILGGGAGIWTYFNDLFIPPVVAMIVSGLIYTLLHNLCRQKEPSV